MNAGKPFKLLMGITLSEMGGAQKVVYDLISSLPRSVYNITLITYPGGELVEWVRDLRLQKGIDVEIIGIPELRREISPIDDISTFIKLYRIMRSNKYDIVHFHSSKNGYTGKTRLIWQVLKIYILLYMAGALTSISQSGFKSYWVQLKDLAVRGALCAYAYQNITEKQELKWGG